MDVIHGYIRMYIERSRRERIRSILSWFRKVISLTHLCLSVLCRVSQQSLQCIWTTAEAYGLKRQLTTCICASCFVFCFERLVIRMTMCLTGLFWSRKQRETIRLHQMSSLGINRRQLKVCIIVLWLLLLTSQSDAVNLLIDRCCRDCCLNHAVQVLSCQQSQSDNIQHRCMNDSVYVCVC